MGNKRDDRMRSSLGEMRTNTKSSDFKRSSNFACRTSTYNYNNIRPLQLCMLYVL